MKNYRTIVVKNFYRSFRLLRDNLRFLIFPMLSDFFFFFIYGFVTKPIFDRMIDYFSVSTALSVSTLVARPESQAAAGPYAKKLVLLFILAAIAIFIIYTFFQGLSWRLSSHYLKNKLSFGEYMIRFIKTSLVWVSVFYIWHVTSLMIDLKRTADQASTTWVGIFSSFALFVIGYFAVISYSSIDHYPALKNIKKTFSLGIKKPQFLIFAYLIILVLFYIINLVMVLAAQIGFLIPAGVILFLPALTWGRIYISLVVKES